MGSETDAPITKVILHYFPNWEPPEDTKDWNPCLCPSHAEDRPSCAVNYEVGAIKCMACDFKGNVVSVIRRQEGVKRNDALRRAEEILGGEYEPVRQQHGRQPRRRVFGEPGAGNRQSRGGQVSPRLRGRSSPWT